MSGPGAREGTTAVLGAGGWGTALAIHLARAGRPARLWARDPTLATSMREEGENARYLPGIPLPPSLRVTADPGEALEGGDVVIVAIPSQHVEGTVGALAGRVSAPAVLVSATKGLEPVRGRRISALLAELCPERAVAVLSGPSFAREVASGLPAACVVAACEEAIARVVQRRLAAAAFRLYTNRDVVGVELAGALKNVVAIAAGLSDSQRLGESARAALITRGLAEIARLGVAMGGHPATFAGLAGLGDLVLTCTGSLSRNRALGLAVGAGARLEDVERGTRTVAEGVRTVSSALRLAREQGVAMPICEAVAAVLFEGQPIGQALASLLARELRPEDEPAGLTR
jgi:glycerol-3-phosphate dehydrogenase (NAD(P)+)